jgi:hypothetical protein
MLVLLFSVQLNWLPAFGDSRVRDVCGPGSVQQADAVAV